MHRSTRPGTRSTTATALLAIGSLVLGACQAAASPAASAAVVTPEPTIAPTIAAEPTLVLPSFNADVDLEALLPDELGGLPTQKFSFAGADFLSNGGPETEDFQKVLTALGKSPADLSVAIAGSTIGQTVGAYRIRGVDAAGLLPAFIAAFQQGDTGATVTDVSYGGKSVKKASSPTDETVYLYASGDVVFFAGGDAVTDAFLNEAFSKLR
jgi:hypothetical protein